MESSPLTQCNDGSSTAAVEANNGVTHIYYLNKVVTQVYGKAAIH